MLLRPWEIFNPFHNGEFIGIRGMSYHGAGCGAIIKLIILILIRQISLDRPFQKIGGGLVGFWAINPVGVYIWARGWEIS